MASTITWEKSQEERANTEEDEIPAEARNKCREIIATLPKCNAWGFLDGQLSQYQTFWCSPFILESAMIAHEHFKAESSDIVLCSHPKTGSTWLKALVFTIATRSRYDISSTTPLLTKLSHECLPSFDVFSLRSKMKHFSGFPIFHSHLPYSYLPKSVINSNCKLVYICREPKDAFVSLWHHYCKRSQQNKGTYISLEDAFELYCNGINDFGPYWDHVLGYWKASLESPERILFLKYEEVLRDTTSYVKRLAEFMGCPFSEEENKGDIVQQIVEFCSFNNLSNLGVNNMETSPFGTMGRTMFYRKGQEGDWKNHFTTEMKERMDNVTKQKLRGSGLTFDA